MYKIIFFFIFTSFCYCQNSDVEQLEYKLIAIEDYLKLELQDVKRNLKQKDVVIEKLQKENKDLLVTLQKLEISLKELEIQVLKLRINPQVKVEEKQNKDVVATDSTVIKKETTTFESRKIEKLAESLKSSDMNIRMATVIKLSNSEESEAVKVLTMALHDKDNYIRILACKVLSKKNDRRVCTDIIKLLEDEDSQIRKQANQALEEITKDSVQFEANGTKEIRSKKIMEWQEKVNNLKE